MTYQERKHKTAKAFASLTIDNKLSTGKSVRIDMTPAGHDRRIKAEFRHAKKAIAMQAEAIKEALYDLLYIPFGASDEEFKRHTDKWLLEHGYIEPKQDFHCNNKGRHYSDPGYKPVCENQCASCAEEYPVNGKYIDPKTEKNER